MGAMSGATGFSFGLLLIGVVLVFYYLVSV